MLPSSSIARVSSVLTVLSTSEEETFTAGLSSPSKSILAKISSIESYSATSCAGDRKPSSSGSSGSEDKLISASGALAGFHFS
jgi:hypothetical protein